MISKIKGALFGLAVGDALGVPVEFRDREKLRRQPVSTMQGYGSWNQPTGTWSDDSSLAFCLAESLTKGYDLDDIAGCFIRWLEEGYWGAHHKVFDVGGATSHAIKRLIGGTSPEFSGGLMIHDNGNGSLMRILPLLFYVVDKKAEERYTMIKQVSAVTHGHFRSVFACFIYLEFAGSILRGRSTRDAYREMQQTVKDFAVQQEFNPDEVKLFHRILDGEIHTFPEKEIHSGGYVLHTLEASLWCLMNSSAYDEAVLKAVNLGGDTDTTACVTGGLAGLTYGYDAIFQTWIEQLARSSDIADLCERLNNKLSG